MKIRLSKFVHIKQINTETTAIYHSISMKVYYSGISYDIFEGLYTSTDKELVAKIFNDNADLKLEFMQILIDNKFIVEDDYNEIEKINRIAELNTSKIQLSTAYFMLTNDCNLRCKYCIVMNKKDDNSANTVMTKDDACRYVDYFYRNAHENEDEYTFTFYGGEPLLYPEHIECIINYIESHPQRKNKKCTYVVISNGLLVTEYFISIIKKYNINLVLSIDGNKEITNTNRVDISGNGIFDRLMKKIQLLRQNYVKYSISCTIGIGQENSVSQTFDFLVDEVKAQNIGLNYILDVQNYPNTTESYAVSLTNELIKIHRKYRNTEIYEDRLARKLKAFLNKSPIIKDCTGCGGQIVFTPDGRIGPCQSFAVTGEYFQQFHSNLNIKETEIAKWNKRTPFTNKDCFFCPALGICGGGCPYRAYIKENKTIFDIDEIFCIHSKMLLNYLIDESYYLCHAE